MPRARPKPGPLHTLARVAFARRLRCLLPKAVPAPERAPVFVRPPHLRVRFCSSTAQRPAQALAAGLANVLRSSGETVPPALAAFGGTVKKKEHPVYGAFFKDVDPSVKATKIKFDSDSD
jgi:hypothetical protein